MLVSTTREASARKGERTISIGVRMTRRPSPSFKALLGLGIAAILLAGCGGVTPTPSPTVTATPRRTATPAATHTSSPAPSGSAAPSASPTPNPCQDLGLPHQNASLEGKLPGMIGGITLCTLSMPLSTYIASTKGGDTILYTPWLAKFGKSPDQIDLAATVDLTQTENFHEQAIEVPGVDAAVLTGGFATVARNNKWPVTPKSIGPVSVLEIVDPATDAAGGLGTAYVFAKGSVMYIVVTDDASLLINALSDLH